MKTKINILLILFFILFTAKKALSIGENQWDNFEDGTTQGWGSGTPNPNPPVNISGGGPNGDDDNYLRVTSTGGNGPGSMLITFNNSQWTGNYITAGIIEVSMHVNNFGSTDLLLRLAFYKATGTNIFWTINAEPVPANSGWIVVNFSVQPMDLTGGTDINAALSSVTQLRIIHKTTGGYQGDPVVAEIGIDNITAAPQPLPVELTSFTAVLADGNVLLNWETSSENNNRGFEIERRINNFSSTGKWQLIGFIEGYGSSIEKHSYNFQDKADNITSSEISYRLKQIDFDGSFKYSRIVSLQLIPGEFALHQNFPNPFNPSTIIDFQLGRNARAELKIFDILGNEIKTIVDENKPAGSYSVLWSGDDNSGNQVNSGIYLYRLSADNFTSVKKMILLR